MLEVDIQDPEEGLDMLEAASEGAGSAAAGCLDRCKQLPRQVRRMASVGSWKEAPPPMKRLKVEKVGSCRYK